VAAGRALGVWGLVAWEASGRQRACVSLEPPMPGERLFAIGIVGCPSNRSASLGNRSASLGPD
jgi:hypothetical protein